MAFTVSASLNNATFRRPGPANREISGSIASSEIDARDYRLFRSLDHDGDGAISIDALKSALIDAGLGTTDRRLTDSMNRLAEYSVNGELTFGEFSAAVGPDILLIEQALQGNLAVPDFEAFCRDLTAIHEQTRRDRRGRVADYIPQLARIDPELFGVGICTVDGQRFAIGDAFEDFCVQSCCKPTTYCLALEEHGADIVHRYVGREPSGRIFNELSLDASGKPHNPMINAGAIMCTSLVKPRLDKADRFDFLLDRWTALFGGEKARFNNAVYQSERENADRNFALGYFMREQGAFPRRTDLLETLDFYFQSCSIEANASMLSVLAATLANGGICPPTGERVFSREHVQHCLSMMSSCGMYDFSGEFAFVVGLPAKSGVCGAVLVVIPNLLGLCVWSPPLDAHGNSVRGVEFCKRLVEKFKVHNLDSMTLESARIDPRANRIRSKSERIGEMIWASSKGDLGAVHRLVARGLDPKHADYDHRTPMHLAAAEGRTHIVEYFIDHGVEVNPRDRWGGTPLDDASRHGHTDLAELLERHGGVRGRAEQNEEDSVAPTVGDVAHEVPGAIIESIYAASQGDLKALRRLVARGINLRGADYDLRTPLHLAAAEGQERVVRYFLDQGFERAPLDRWGNTPLDEAKRHGHDRVVELIRSLEEGRDPEDSP